MANMSYCRFENTSNDLDDCLDVLDDASDSTLSFGEFTEDMSHYEQSALHKMYRQCKQFIKLYEEVTAKGA